MYCIYHEKFRCRKNKHIKNLGNLNENYNDEGHMFNTEFQRNMCLVIGYFIPTFVHKLK